MTTGTPTGTIMLDGVSPERALGWYRRTALIRAFETCGEQLVAQGRLVGGMHSARGQEGTAVGIMDAVRTDDMVTATHRSHHVVLARGVPTREVMAELMGKATGCAGGRGGHMHLVDVGRGYYGSNAIVGSAVGLAMGAAFAHHYRHDDKVAVGFVGDGGINIGRVWESANLAAIWQLPLIIVCENNQYAVETPIGQVLGGGSIVARGKAFGLESWSVDGQDVAECARVAAAAVARARAGGGPSLIEARTYRYSGHDVGDQETYRTRDEVERWQHDGDPVRRLRDALTREGQATDDELDRLDADVAAEVADAVAYGEQSPDPDPATRYRNVYSSQEFAPDRRFQTSGTTAATMEDRL